MPFDHGEKTMPFMSISAAAYLKQLVVFTFKKPSFDVKSTDSALCLFAASPECSDSPHKINYKNLWEKKLPFKWCEHKSRRFGSRTAA